MKTIAERRAERAQWSDERLTAELAHAAAGERRLLVELLLNLVEFDHRSLSEKGAHHTLFDYCTRKLGYSSSEAGRRIAVARKSEKLPLLLEMIDRGELHLSGAAMLAGLLTPENQAEVLSRAKDRTQDEIGRLVAALAPRPKPRDGIRAIRAPALGGLAAAAEPISAPASASASVPASAPASAPVCSDLFGDHTAPPPQPPAAREELYAVAFCATAETKILLARATELLRHRFPKGDIDDIVNLALKKLLAAIDRDLRKPAAPPREAGAPKARPVGAPRSRHIPEAVKQEAWRRDGGRCAFIAEDGTRCASRAWLEFDHAVPYALGGSSADAANIRLYCRQHNALAAERVFGPWKGGKMKPQDTS